MPLYEYQCKCGWQTEKILLLLEFDKEIRCNLCGRKMSKLFNKLTTTCKNKDRKWGQSLYRKQGDKVKAPKMPGYIPAGLKKD